MGKPTANLRHRRSLLILKMSTKSLFTPETEAIVASYGFRAATCSLEKLGNGNINQTFLLTDGQKGRFVLQKINTSVFKNPQDIVDNWLLVRKHLASKAPHYRMLEYLPTVNGKWLSMEADGSCWRLIAYIENSYCIQAASSSHLAAKTAAAFAQFTEMLQDIDPSAFKEILPSFHDLGLRQQQFDIALQNASSEKIALARETLEELQNCRWITARFLSIIHLLPQRVVHTDAKISNVLFDVQTHDVACIIDLDTLMMGTILSDVGDMIRSMVCAVGENENDLSLIKVNSDIFEALVKNYTQKLNSITEIEMKFAPFSGLILVYMQALRFLTDFLQNDIYYTIQYPLHNLDRAKNQTKLLLELIKEPLIQGCFDERI